MHISVQRTMRAGVGALLAGILLAGCSASVTSAGKPTQTNASTSATSATSQASSSPSATASSQWSTDPYSSTGQPPPAMSKSEAQAAFPSNISAAIPSQLATTMAIGQVAYTDAGQPEGAPREPEDSLLQAHDGFCTSWGLRVWPSAGRYVDGSQLITTDAVVLRTGANSFTVVLSPDGTPRYQITLPVLSCKHNPKLTFSTDPKLTALIGYPTRIKVGTTRYIPGGRVDMANAHSKTAYLIVDSSSPTPFPGSVALTRTKGGLVVHGDRRLLDVAWPDQFRADKQQGFTLAIVK